MHPAHQSSAALSAPNSSAVAAFSTPVETQSAPPTPSTLRETPLPRPHPQVTATKPYTDATIERRVANLDKGLLDLIQAELGKNDEIDFRELFDRLSQTEENIVNGIIPINKKVDLSKVVDDKNKNFKKMRSVKEGKSKRKLMNKIFGCMKRFKKVNKKDRAKNGPESTGHGATVHAAIDVTRPGSVAPASIPAPPQHIDANDNTSLAIYYHEHNNLELSVYYLEKSALDGNPIGLYLLAMCLRHGWGVCTDETRALRCLIRSAQAVITNLSEHWNRQRQESPRMSQDSSQGSVNSSMERDTGRVKTGFLRNRNGLTSTSLESLSKSVMAARTPVPPIRTTSLRRPSTASRQSTWSLFSTASKIMTAQPTYNIYEELQILRTILPLPLLELAQSFRHGWGTAKSLPASYYFFHVAAVLEDVDAMVETGYMLLKGVGVNKNKKAAGRWFRKSVAAGKEVIGESWIWKEKWMRN